MGTKERLVGNTSVLDFLENIERQLLTETTADAIREEMLDHIQCMVEDYEADGMCFDEAIEQALRNMGDPLSIGYAFTDFNAMKRREWLRKTLKYSGLSLLIAFFVYWVGMDIINGEEDMVSFLILMIEMPMIYAITKYGITYRKEGHASGYRRKRYLDLTSKPVMILWPAKKSIPFEYIALPLFFSPIFIILFVGVLSDVIHAQKVVLFVINVVVFLGGIFLLFFSEKYRIPKYVVLEDGLLIKGKLLSWTSMAKVQFKTDYSYKEKPTKVIYQMIEGMHAGSIFINPKQVTWLKAFMREKVNG